LIRLGGARGVAPLPLRGLSFVRRMPAEAARKRAKSIVTGSGATEPDREANQGGSIPQETIGKTLGKSRENVVTGSGLHFRGRRSWVHANEGKPFQD